MSSNQRDYLDEIDYNLFVQIIKKELGDEGVQILSFLTYGYGKRKISKAMNLPYSKTVQIIERIKEIYKDYYIPKRRKTHGKNKSY